MLAHLFGAAGTVLWAVAAALPPTGVFFGEGGKGLCLPICFGQQAPAVCCGCCASPHRCVFGRGGQGVVLAHLFGTSGRALCAVAAALPPKDFVGKTLGSTFLGFLR